MELKIGDVVVLKSGGPLMTIINIENNKAICSWFDKNKPNQSIFILTSIVKDERE